MSVTTAASMPARDRLALVILSAFAAGCMLAAALMTMQVLGKLDEYGSAKQDNLQWTMSQLEVDQLRFRLSLERLNVSDPASIENVRRQFDLLYSRAMTLQRGEVYRTVIRDGAMEDDLNLMVALLAQMVPIIDAPDTDLHAASDRLAALAGRMTAPIRAVATQAITVDARRSDAERTVLTSQIITLTILILLMVTALYPADHALAALPQPSTARRGKPPHLEPAGHDPQHLAGCGAGDRCRWLPARYQCQCTAHVRPAPQHRERCAPRRADLGDRRRCGW